MRIIIDNHEAYIGLARACSAFAIYFIGLGRYRFVIAILIYDLVNAALKLKHRWILDYVLLPVVIITLVFDVKLGPLNPVFSFNSVLLAFVLLVVTDKAVKIKAERLISKLSNNRLFNNCPSCGYANMDLSSQCSNCKYTSEMAIVSNNSTATHTDKLKKMLNLQNEPILYKLRLFPLVSLIVNDKKETIMFLLITDTNLILVDYFYFSRSWTKKDVVSIDSILSVTKTERTSYVTTEPTLQICTDTNKYELVFLKIFDIDSKMERIMEILKGKTKV